MPTDTEMQKRVALSRAAARLTKTDAWRAGEQDGRARRFRAELGAGATMDTLSDDLRLWLHECAEELGDSPPR